MDTATQLEQLLARRAWRFERVDDATLASRFKSRAASFPFFIRLTPDWIFFTIVPFVQAPIDERALFRLYRRLLQLNQLINFAKFAVDEAADVVLTVELPSEGVRDSELDDALDALCFYADAHHAELHRLAAGAPS